MVFLKYGRFVTINYHVLQDLNYIVSESYVKKPLSYDIMFPVTIGHETVMAKTTYFGVNSPVSDSRFDNSLDYTYQDELYGQQQLPEVNWIHIFNINNYIIFVRWTILMLFK